MVEKNAIIERVFIGMEGHGIFTCIISMKSGASFHSFGNFFGQDGAPVGVFLAKFIKTLGKESLGECVNCPVRIQVESAGTGRVLAVGHFMEDKWLTESDFVYNRGDWKDGKS